MYHLMRVSDGETISRNHQTLLGIINHYLSHYMGGRVPQFVKSKENENVKIMIDNEFEYLIITDE